MDLLAFLIWGKRFDKHPCNVVKCEDNFPKQLISGRYIAAANVKGTSNSEQATGPVEETSEHTKESKISWETNQYAEETDTAGGNSLYAKETIISEETKQHAEETYEYTEESKISGETNQYAEETDTAGENNLYAEETVISKETNQHAEETNISEKSIKCANRTNYLEETNKHAKETNVPEAKKECAKRAEASKETTKRTEQTKLSDEINSDGSRNKSSCSCTFKTINFYLISGLSGMAATGLAHAAVIPLDIIKTQMQMSSALLKDAVSALRMAMQEEGTRGLVKGWKPTLIGYSAQGFIKYGLYEVLKDTYGDMMGPENAYIHRTSNYLLAGASAEFFADLALSPMEALKVKLQTSGHKDTTTRVMMKMLEQEGILGFYKGLMPLWVRQIPYTAIKFVSFERTPDLVYGHLVSKPQEQYSESQQLLIMFLAGIAAGAIGAAISHPADTVFTRVNQRTGDTTLSVLRDLGFRGLWIGLGPRVIMSGTLTAIQWFIYDSLKMLTDTKPPPPRMPPSIKKKKKKKKKKRKKKKIKQEDSREST